MNNRTYSLADALGMSIDSFANGRLVGSMTGEFRVGTFCLLVKQEIASGFSDDDHAMAAIKFNGDLGALAFFVFGKPPTLMLLDASKLPEGGTLEGWFTDGKVGVAASQALLGGALVKAFELHREQWKEVEIAHDLDLSGHAALL